MRLFTPIRFTKRKVIVRLTMLLGLFIFFEAFSYRNTGGRFFTDWYSSDVQKQLWANRFAEKDFVLSNIVKSDGNSDAYVALIWPNDYLSSSPCQGFSKSDLDDFGVSSPYNDGSQSYRYKIIVFTRDEVVDEVLFRNQNSNGIKVFCAYENERKCFRLDGLRLVLNKAGADVCYQFIEKGR